MQEVTYKDLPALGVVITPHTIRKKMRKGRFPKPTRGGGRGDGRFYWRRDDIVSFVRAERTRNAKNK